MHVENLKRIHDREHSELEESRKLLAANNLSVEDHRRPGGLEASGSLSPSLGRPNSRGRSVSVIHPGQGSPTNTLGAALVSMILEKTILWYTLTHSLFHSLHGSVFAFIT